jgi:Leucine-rich repeat (LRR) protein
MLPPEIGNLTNLTHLSLSNNPIESLPIEILNLNNLESLYLTNYNTISAKTLALLFRGSFIEAKEIYVKNKDSKDDFLKDIYFLEKCGINLPDFEKVKALLKTE